MSFTGLPSILKTTAPSKMSLYSEYSGLLTFLILIPSLNLLYSSEDTILEPEYTIKVIGHQ